MVINIVKFDIIAYCSQRLLILGNLMFDSRERRKNLRIGKCEANTVLEQKSSRTVVLRLVAKKKIFVSTIISLAHSQTYHIKTVFTMHSLNL